MAYLHSRSIEELSGLLENTFRKFSRPHSSRLSIEQDHEGFIEEILTDLKSSRQKVLETASIAKEILELYHSSTEETADANSRYQSLVNSLEKYEQRMTETQREISDKEYRVERMTQELTDMERNMRLLEREKEQVQRENNKLRMEKERSEQQMRVKNDNFNLQKQIKEEQDQNSKAKLNELNENIVKLREENKRLEFKIREVESMHQIEKKAGEKLRNANTKFKLESGELKNKVKELNSNISTLKLALKQKENDEMETKSYYESMLKELNTQLKRRTSFALSSEEIGIASRGSFVETERKETIENLGDFIEEVSEEDQEDEFLPEENFMFVLSTPRSDFPSIQFPVTYEEKDFDITYEERILILPEKKKLSLAKIEGVEIFGQLPRTVQTKRLFHLFHCESTFCPGKFRAALVFENQESVSLIKETLSNYSEADSIDSEDTQHTRNNSIAGYMDVRDPIKEYFELVIFIKTCQAAKLNSQYKDSLGRLPINKLYEKVLTEGVPFNIWHDWVQQYLHKRMRNKISV